MLSLKNNHLTTSKSLFQQKKQVTKNLYQQLRQKTRKEEQLCARKTKKQEKLYEKLKCSFKKNLRKQKTTTFAKAQYSERLLHIANCKSTQLTFTCSKSTIRTPEKVNNKNTFFKSFYCCLLTSHC